MARPVSLHSKIFSILLAVHAKDCLKLGPSHRVASIQVNGSHHELNVFVSVRRIKCLHHRSERFKVQLVHP